jgi:hypothetical protein
LEEEKQRLEALIKKGTDDIRFLEVKLENLDRTFKEKKQEQENFLLLDRERQLQAI